MDGIKYNLSWIKGLAAAAYILAGLVFLLMLRPDPLIVAKAIAEAQSLKESKNGSMETNVPEMSVNKRGIIEGATVMVLTQIVMIAIMTLTPVHMKAHGHGMGEVGIVIGIHVASMFLPSLITGVLVDKYGRTLMSFASGVWHLLHFIKLRVKALYFSSSTALRCWGGGGKLVVYSYFSFKCVISALGGYQ